MNTFLCRDKEQLAEEYLREVGARIREGAPCPPPVLRVRPELTGQYAVCAILRASRWPVAFMIHELDSVAYTNRLATEKGGAAFLYPIALCATREAAFSRMSEFKKEVRGLKSISAEVGGEKKQVPLSGAEPGKEP